MAVPPPAWTNQRIVLYHGTADIHLNSILAGVNHSIGRRYTDFGRGFYTTTSLKQAQTWARGDVVTPSMKKVGAKPVVIQFEVERELLAELETLCFVRGDADAEDYWSLVWHCRRTGGDHMRSVKNGWYDVVYGPVATAVLQDRLVVQGSDQIGFHTQDGADLLDASNPQVI